MKSMCYRKWANPKDLYPSFKLPTLTEIEQAAFSALGSEISNNFKLLGSWKAWYYLSSLGDLLGTTDYNSIKII